MDIGMDFPWISNGFGHGFRNGFRMDFQNKQVSCLDGNRNEFRVDFEWIFLGE